MKIFRSSFYISSLLFTALFVSGIFTEASAQRFAYVHADSILARMPQFAEAEKQLEVQDKKWKAELRQKEKNLMRLKMKFEAEKVLLTLPQLKQREKLIATEEEEFQARRDEVYGLNGLYFQERNKLVQPLQREVADAIWRVSKKKNVSFIFNASADRHMLYADPSYDFTDYVLEELGLPSGPRNN